MNKIYKSKIINYSFVFNLLLSCFASYSQTQSNVTTPKGSPVEAWIYPELSASDRASYDNYWANAYPNADMKDTYDGYSSTYRFNCHGYAWYMSENSPELSNPRWIGNGSISHEDVYMSDGSYVQVANEMYPGKVSWPSADDHSAITTSQPGVFISKWGNKPWMEHDWDDQPYGTTGLKYYVSTDISGSSSVLCNNSTRSFLTRNIPNADYDWAVGPGITLNDNGEYSTSVTAGSSYSGETWIEVEITSPLGGGNEDVKISKRLIFWAGKPNPNNIEFFSDPWGLEHELSTCETVSGEADHPYESMISAYQWDIPNASDWEITEEYSGGSSDYKYVEIDYWEDPAPSQELVRVRATNSCGTSSWKSIYWDVDDCGGYFMMISPNPADSYIDITFDKDQLVESGFVAADQSYDFGSNPYFRIVDRYGQVKLTQKYSGKELTRLNISQLPPGLYVVQLITRDKVTGTKIVISR